MECQINGFVPVNLVLWKMWDGMGPESGIKSLLTNVQLMCDIDGENLTQTGI